jgi:hypothetical protein
MKKIVSLLMCSLVVVNLFGCASQQAHQNYLDAFDASAKGYYEAASKPLMDMKLPAPEGKEYHLIVNREVKPMAPQQIKDSEWTGAVIAGIAGAATVGLGVVKLKMTESDNDAKVAMAQEETKQLEAYVGNFKKDTTIIMTEGASE